MMRKNIEIKKVSEKGLVEAVIATMNVIDKDGDITLPGFFGEQHTVMLPTHDWRSVPLGKATIREEKDKAIASIKMNLDIAAARDWHSSLKFDLANGKPKQEWSYGFRILEGGSEMGTMDSQNVRFLKPLSDGSPGVKVDEISPVIVGAGEGTGTLSVKGDQKRRFSDEAEAALAAIISLGARTKSLAELRAKQGRSLSAANQETLLKLVKEIDTMLPELKHLLVSEEAEIRRAANIEFRRLIQNSKSLGGKR